MKIDLTRSGYLIALISLFLASSPLYVKAQVKASLIKGTVQSTENTPLASVSVIIRNLKTNFTSGTSTDSSGTFTFSRVPSGGPYSFTFSTIGFETQTLSGYNIKENITLALVVKMKESAGASLDQVVVIGYGTVRKKDLTGTVSTIKGDEILKSPSGNVLEAVAGKLSGVDITRTSGSAGAGVNITVRGNRSINAGNDPLYIVDGIQYPTIEDINPNDILSMDVLKDASTTAIYGARGANGVIIITTKRGATGKVKVTGGTYYGISDITGYPKPMNGSQYLDLKRQGFKTNGTWNSIADDPKIFTPAELESIKNNSSTYWPGLLLNQGSQQDYNLGISGGTDKTKVYLSFDYFKEKGLLSNDYSNRYTLRLNVDQTIFENFKVGLESQLAYYDQNLRSDAILNTANKALPWMTPYNTDGTLTNFAGTNTQTHPLSDEFPGAYVNQNNITRILSTGHLEWKPIEGLVIRSNLGIVNGSSRNGHFEGASTIVRALSTGSISSVANTTRVDLTWENIISYQKKLGSHSLNLTAVTSYLSNRRDNSTSSATGQLLESQSFYALQNNPNNLVLSSNYVRSNTEALAFRFNYSFKEKYLFSFTGREDGASVLAPKNRWSFFPSAAVAWRVIDENFMQSAPVFSDLKLRGSIGLAGNSAVQPYQTQSSLILIPLSWNDQTALAYGLQPQIGNEDLTWELTETKNLGLDVGILKNKISGSVDVYDSRTKDLLYLQNLPTTTGVRAVLNNIGKTRNSGVEISIRTQNVQTRDLLWTSNVTYTRNKERILYLPNGSDIANSLIIGYPIRSFYDYQKTGIWQTADKDNASKYGYKPGDIKVLDASGPNGMPDGKITALNDRMVIGSAVPRYSAGLNNDIKYKNFTFNFFVFARIGQTFISEYANKFEPNAVENGAYVDYWTPDHPTNAYPQPDSKISRASLPFASTLGYEDGSFVKIRNMTIGYILPASFTKKLHLTSIRWYVSAKNYITLYSKVKGYDPEGGGSFNSPLTKLIVTGLNIEF